MPHDIDRRPNTSVESLALLLGRLALAAIFLQSGFGKLMNLGGFTQMLASQGVPAPSLLGPVGACIEFFGALAVALGFKARWAALLMIAFTIAATLTAHRFWAVPDAERALQQIQFFKNLAILGGFLLLFARGAGPISVDDAVWPGRAGASRPAS
ncbi:DoxX family protein [Benzoatithermus flavus]|uniref:DoxX family protein n=1 Tax=Benzoatithermus flavus TaxID=3108223 RepID=A0ABU8XP61_9PROT